MTKILPAGTNSSDWAVMPDLLFEHVGAAHSSSRGVVVKVFVCSHHSTKAWSEPHVHWEEGLLAQIYAMLLNDFAMTLGLHDLAKIGYRAPSMVKPTVVNYAVPWMLEKRVFKQDRASTYLTMLSQIQGVSRPAAEKLVRQSLSGTMKLESGKGLYELLMERSFSFPQPTSTMGLNREAPVQDAKPEQAPAVERPESVDLIEASEATLPSLRRMHHADAGFLSYVVGLTAAASFMALAIGPGWAGFLAGFVPVSVLTSWAIASHE